MSARHDPRYAADLFEHFGVVLDPPLAERVVLAPGGLRPRPPQATACRGCGWLRPAGTAGACPICGHDEERE
ncbi:MAG: hypothetical protein KC636_37980 [Myxococcales bacterium]|nr:hypothetical protein [Myxococcales bacterium]